MFGGWIEYSGTMDDGVTPYTSSYGFGETTEEMLRETLAKGIAYYEGIGRHIDAVELFRNCETCDGGGRQPRKKRQPTWVASPPCKACKGTGKAETLLAEVTQ